MRVSANNIKWPHTCLQPTTYMQSSKPRPSSKHKTLNIKLHTAGTSTPADHPLHTSRSSARFAQPLGRSPSYATLKIPVTLRSHSGHTPVTLRSHSGHTPVTLRSHSGHTPRNPPVAYTNSETTATQSRQGQVYRVWAFFSKFS